MRIKSKVGLVAGLVGLSAAAMAPPALAGGYFGGGYGGYYGPGYYNGHHRSSYRYDYRRGHRGNGISNGQAVLLGVGALGLGLVLSDAFDRDKPRRDYDYRPRADRDDRGYDAYENRDSVERERRRLENERAALENERLRLENEAKRRALGDDAFSDLDDDFDTRGLAGKDSGGGIAPEDDLDRDLAGATGRLSYDRAFQACLADARQTATRQDITIAAPYTWAEAQPLGAEAVRFRANLGRDGFDMVCDVSRSGVTRMDLTGV